MVQAAEATSRAVDKSRLRSMQACLVKVHGLRDTCLVQSIKSPKTDSALLEMIEFHARLSGDEIFEFSSPQKLTPILPVWVSRDTNNSAHFECPFPRPFDDQLALFLDKCFTAVFHSLTSHN